jgi:hypothetical protein
MPLFFCICTINLVDHTTVSFRLKNFSFFLLRYSVDFQMGSRVPKRVPGKSWTCNPLLFRIPLLSKFDVNSTIWIAGLILWRTIKIRSVCLQAFHGQITSLRSPFF